MSIVDEANETYEDPIESTDKDETMPQLQQEKTSPQPIHKRTKVPKSRMQLHDKTLTTRERHDALVFKSDSLRKKYDLRNVDEKTINNIFLRAHIKQLKDRTKQQC